MKGWSAIISLSIGLAIYRTINNNPGIIDSAIVGGLSGAIGGVISFIYQHYFGKYNASAINWIDNILWFLLFCIPGAVLGYILSSFFNESSLITLLVMVITSSFLTIRKIKKKDKILKRDLFEDLH